MIEQIYFDRKGIKYQVDLSKPADISIPLRSGTDNPNCYFTQPVQIEAIRNQGFVGSVAAGGNCNHRRITVAPHGNGTHTECYGHISADPDITLNNCLKYFHFMAQLITVKPLAQSEDHLIDHHQIVPHLHQADPQALIIRTLPNSNEKLNRQYSGSNPPYLSASLCQALAEAGIEHLLVDLPSVDREVDGGTLAAHKSFWGFPHQIRAHCTITELVYVPDEVADGLYLLNLQITSLESDASPSKPVLYPLI